MDTYAHEGHPVWGEIHPELQRTQDFNYPDHMDPRFLANVIRPRRRSGVPFRVVSDYRPPERNAAAGGATKSAHMESPCAALDLRVLNNQERYYVVTNLLAYRALDFIEDLLNSGSLTPEQEFRAKSVLEVPGFQRLGIYVPTQSQQNNFGRASGTVHVDDSPHNPGPSIWMSW